MLKNKKFIVTVMIILLICILLILATMFILPYFNKNSQIQNIANTIGQKTEDSESEEELEKDFLNLFSNVNYSDENQEIVSTLYESKQEEENRFGVDVHIPKINFETCQDINDEILETFGRKLLNIRQEATEYTKYNVDYVSYTNDGIISLIIKCTLKEGSNPQRLMIKTYNYYINEERLLTFDEIISSKGLDEQKIQEKINNTIRAKNTNTKELAEQGYNVYVRNTNSNEYQISNIENFYINDNGEVFIIFAYGNKSFTETIDLIKAE